jgi:hypothetical protein
MNSVFYITKLCVFDYNASMSQRRVIMHGRAAVVESLP